MYFIKIPKLNLIIFYNARVGCTTIKRWAAAILGLYPKPGQYIHELFPYNKNDVSTLLRSPMKKVLVTRSPINRILSAAEHHEILYFLGLKPETPRERRVETIVRCVEDSIPNYTFTNNKLQHHLDLQCRMLQDPNFHQANPDMRRFFQEIINLDNVNLLDALNALLPPGHPRVAMNDFNKREKNENDDRALTALYETRVNAIYSEDWESLLPEKLT